MLAVKILVPSKLCKYIMKSVLILCEINVFNDTDTYVNHVYLLNTLFQKYFKFLTDKEFKRRCNRE